MTRAHASAPGKIILFGEHAVVHGQPAIAVPLSAVNVTVEAEPAQSGAGLTITLPASDRVLSFRTTPPDDPLYNALILPAYIALHALALPEPDLTLIVYSTIPIASGLGSGAALAAALIRALASALGRPLSNDALNPLVYEVEKRHHGTPSGIDNTVIVYQQPVYFVRGRPPIPFTIARPFTLLVADSGHSSPTHIAVADVRRLYENEPERVGAIFMRIGQIVESARASIESGKIENIGSLMDENHALLSTLTVSSPELDRLCEAAHAAGATGAKLSGAGRGGNMIALTAPDRAENIAAALRDAGARRVIQTLVGNRA